jgi:hypothetical protein
MAGAEDLAIFFIKNCRKGINNNMAVVSFNNQALSAFGLQPTNLSWSLSSAGIYKTVELLTVGTGPVNDASLSGKRVEGIAFNTLTAPASGTGIFVTLSAPTGTSLRVDRAYNGSRFAIIYKDGTSSLFTCTTATSAQTITFNSYETGYPEISRLVYLGYI